MIHNPLGFVKEKSVDERFTSSLERGRRGGKRKTTALMK